ncbi:MAG: AAA domain-containing protein, partial [Candidatus Heimdallarchaeota archaeon]|nr:AAA domain-containing protein [Candidatus Heimdallarchaeota archaeon]
PRQLTEAGNQVVPAKEKNSTKRLFSARVYDFDEFEQLLIFENSNQIKHWPDEGKLFLEGDMASNRRKRAAIHQLKSRGLSAHAKLADILIRPWGLPSITHSPRSYYNTGISHDNVQSQPQAIAVDKSLDNGDITLIHGPPGTGKTTVIVEIIRHVIANGGRVIMCAPTHVAVDNVLERTSNIRGISAIRVGGTQYMDENLRQFRLGDKSKSYKSALPSLQLVSSNDKSLSSIQQSFISSMEDKGRRYLESFAIEQANLVCGTTIGIARFEPPRDNPIDFDVLIIDEASKTTVMEFLVPAIRAKKWILVGDHRQLPPYVNEQEIRIYVQRYFEQINTDIEDTEKTDNGIYDEKTNNLIASLRRYHEELHAMGEGDTEYHWKKILEIFNFEKKPIISVKDMIDFALGSCFHYFLQRVDETRNARLLVQHRMPEILADFLDKVIYKGGLKTSSSAQTHGFQLPAFPTLGIPEISQPLVFLSTENLKKNYETPGKYKGYHNVTEAIVIAELIDQLSSLNAKELGYSDDNPLTIGIITYYAGQSKIINKHLRTVDTIQKERGWRYHVPNKPIKIRVSIVDRFQGQEQEIVILSITRSNRSGGIGFLKNLQRVNVSLSRAKQNLIVVGNARFLSNVRTKPAPILKQLADYCNDKNLIFNIDGV